MTNRIRNIGFAAALLLAVGLGYLIARISAPAPAASGNAGTAQQSDSLKLDASYLNAVGIAMQRVIAGNLSADVLAPGTVTATPSGQAVVTAHAAGTIVRIAKQLGDPVKPGETLALVESREAAAMAAERTVAEAKAALARSAAAREQELFDQRVTPRQDLERARAELAAANAEVRRARDAAAAAHVTSDGKIAVTSPITGRITSATATLGTFVQPQTELFRIADPEFIQIEASVTAADAGRISAGDPAKVMLTSGDSVEAMVRSTTPTLNEQTRTATVVLSLMGEHELLKPGEVVQVDIAPRNAAPGGFVVPEDAVQNVGGRNVVFVRTADGFKVQPVVLGARGQGRASIVRGLNGGETIATTNAFFLKAELGKAAAGEEE